MKLNINANRIIGKRDPMIYGQFIEHFHRQIYGGVYDPGSPLSDEDGLRTDVLAALRKIQVPVLRWPGGCFVSAYHWKEAVGKDRKPSFDKAWRVEDPNTFGTDEYVKMCRKIGCAPYICTNAGSGTAEEMSDWVEYCNLKDQGRYAKWRIENGSTVPHAVKYWSIGNENYLGGEIGAKTKEEWGRLVEESAKMMKRVDPSIELSAAALSDVEWNVNLLKCAGRFLDWISVHSYWDGLWQDNTPADYETCMAYTAGLPDTIRQVRGLLTAMGLEKKIRIAYDEWNLRGWHHPKVDTALTKEEYLLPRDKNDDNSQYTMADAVFAACFLNMCLRNCDIVGMANYAPVVNTRGLIFTHPEGIVLRTAYHVFDLFVNYMGDTVVDTFAEDMPVMTARNNKSGTTATVDALDVAAARWSDRDGLSISAVNKDPVSSQGMVLDPCYAGCKVQIYTVNGPSPDAYNDIGREEVKLTAKEAVIYEKDMILHLEPHSVNVIHVI